MVTRGLVYWVDFGELGEGSSRPAKVRPAVVVQADPLNRSGWGTVVVAALSSNTRLAEPPSLPTIVLLSSAATGLPRDSVLDAAALLTVDRAELQEPVGRVPAHLMHDVDAALRWALGDA